MLCLGPCACGVSPAHPSIRSPYSEVCPLGGLTPGQSIHPRRVSLSAQTFTIPTQPSKACSRPHLSLRRETASMQLFYLDALVVIEHRKIVALIGSRALAASGAVDGSSAAKNHPWSRKWIARLLQRSDTSASAYGGAGTHSAQLAGAGSVG